MTVPEAAQEVLPGHVGATVGFHAGVDLGQELRFGEGVAAILAVDDMVAEGGLDYSRGLTGCESKRGLLKFRHHHSGSEPGQIAPRRAARGVVGLRRGKGHEVGARCQQGRYRVDGGSPGGLGRGVGAACEFKDMAYLYLPEIVSDSVDAHNMDAGMGGEGS